MLIVLIMVTLIFASYFALAQLDLLPATFSSSPLSPTAINGSIPVKSELPSISPTVSPNTASVTNEPSPTFFISPNSKSIVRIANTTEEKTALQSAEDFDYPKAFNTTLQRGQYANFIDTDVINYYSRWTEYLQEGINLDYRANSNAWSQAEVTITSNLIQLTSPTKTSTFTVKKGWGFTATVAYLNVSHYQSVRDTVNFDLPCCYVVRMDLIASDVLGPTNGFWNTINQIVILNDSFVPVAFGIQSQHLVS